MRSPITAPPARPPRFGLIASAPVVDDGDLRILAGGWSYQPEGCGLGGIDSITCAGSVDGSMADPGNGPDVVSGDPLWIWAGDECSTFGFEARDWEGRARRALAATESFRLARELWDGTQAQAHTPDLANRWLSMTGAESDTVTNGASSPTTALANLEAGLAEALTGQQGMIHVTVQALTHLAQAGAVALTGTTWTSPNGHIVVADAGYTGSGPGGVAASTTQWAYATPTIQVRLGPVEIIPGSLGDARGLAAAMDREVNSIVVVAGRLAGYQWANECAHFAAQLDLPVALVGGAS